VAVVFAVCLVVLAIVRNEVVQCEAVMTGHEVNALLCLAFFMSVYCRTAEQAVGNPCHGPFFAANKAPHIVPETSVPLLPAIPDEAAYFVQSAGVPGLGDELGSGKRRVRFDIPQYGRIRHRIT